MYWRAISLVVVPLVLPGTGHAQERVMGPHGALRLPVDCAGCHAPAAWRVEHPDQAFDHNRHTRFRRTGRHADLNCRRCHQNLRFAEQRFATPECANCHVDVHQGNLGTECRQCHNTTTVPDVAGAAVHARTSFPLTGAHLQITCEACHGDDRGGAFTTRSPECISCHAADYASAQTVDHAAAGFPTDCLQCHVSLSFVGGAEFDHLTASGGFALLGAHADLRCASCHVQPGNQLRFSAPAGPTDCIACHEGDYQRQHGGRGWPTTCLDCHDVFDWDGEFDHAAATGFELLGVHASFDCSTCHLADGTPRFAPTSSDDCVTCHQSQYQAQHASFGFPTTCVTCHTPTAWTNVSFDHDGQFFPIFSGRHQGRWSRCPDCHMQVDDFRVFSCFACHQPADTQDKHSGVQGFVYESTACLGCHPNGEEP